MAAFRKRLWMRMLIIDDIHLLADRQRSRQEFVSIIAGVLASGGKALTTAEPPGLIEGTTRSFRQFLNAAPS